MKPVGTSFSMPLGSLARGNYFRVIPPKKSIVIISVTSDILIKEYVVVFINHNQSVECFSQALLVHHSLGLLLMPP